MSAVPYDEILALSPSVVYVTTADSFATPRFVSTNIERLLARPSHEFTDGTTYLWDLVHEEDREIVLVHLRAPRSSEPVDLPDYRLRSRLQSGEPHEVWVSHRLIAHGPDTTLHFFEDITDRKRIENDLAFHKERLELVLEGTRLGMWDWSPQTNDVVFNERWATMLGHELSEIEQELSSWESRVHPDDLAACYADITAHVEGQTTFYENIHRMRHKDGSWRYILDRGKIVERDRDGKPLRFTGTHTDITRQKRAEFDAMAADQAKSYFLANMSHELRGPLNGILGLNTLLSQSLSDPELLDFVQAVKECGQSLLVIINDILDFSKIEAGKLQLDPQPFDLHQMIASVLLLCRERAVAKKLQLTSTVDPAVPQFIRSDSTRLRQILMNLLTNALKFTTQGEISLSVGLRAESDAGCELEFSVRDTGIGLTPQEQSWIFERFMQGDRGARRHGGTGLGLSISRLLAQMLGGQLGVDSQKGQGSCFSFTIKTERTDPPPRLAPSARPTLSGLRILAAEDNRINQLVLGKVLERMGAQCTMVANGQLAVDAARGQAFDLIIMDLNMPELDGLEATGMLKREHGPQCPPIVGLSADAFAETRKMCFDAGMDGFVTKPFDHDQLADTLARIAS